MSATNLENIDWRPLINLWPVPDYREKYAMKIGQGSTHLGSARAHFFRNCLSAMMAVIESLCCIRARPTANLANLADGNYASC